MEMEKRFDSEHRGSVIILVAAIVAIGIVVCAHVYQLQQRIEYLEARNDVLVQEVMVQSLMIHQGHSYEEAVVLQNLMAAHNLSYDIALMVSKDPVIQGNATIGGGRNDDLGPGELQSVEPQRPIPEPIPAVQDSHDINDEVGAGTENGPFVPKD